MKPSAEGGHQTPSNDRSVTRQEVSLEKKENELSSGSFNNLSDRGPRRPDQVRRYTYKHKPAAGYEPGILSSDISSEGCEVSTTGGGLVWLIALFLASIGSIIASTVIALCSEFTFLPTLGLCYLTIISLILFLIGLYTLITLP